MFGYNKLRNEIKVLNRKTECLRQAILNDKIKAKKLEIKNIIEMIIPLRNKESINITIECASLKFPSDVAYDYYSSRYRNQGLYLDWKSVEVSVYHSDDGALWSRTFQHITDMEELGSYSKQTWNKLLGRGRKKKK